VTKVPGPRAGRLWDGRLAFGQLVGTAGGQGHFDPLTAFETGYNPADPVDQAIMATRKAVFPLHGLMP